MFLRCVTLALLLLAAPASAQTADCGGVALSAAAKRAGQNAKATSNAAAAARRESDIVGLTVCAAPLARCGGSRP